MEFGVEDDVADTLLLEDFGEEFRLLDACGADEDGLLFFVEAGYLVRNGEVLFLGGAEDDIGVFDALHDAVGGGDDDVELVDFVELGGFRLGGAGHAAEFFVHAEVVLEGDGREGLVFLADGDAFLGFDSLMQAVGPTATGHEATGELVDDDDLAVLDDVLDIAFVEIVGLDGDFDVMLEIPVFGVGDVADAEEALDLFPAFIGDRYGAGLFVDDEVTGPGFIFKGFGELAEFEFGNDDVDADVLVGGLVGGTGDDERGAGFIDEDGVDFVDDAEVMAALDHIGELELHVVAEVVEAELVVGAVGDVGGVGFAALLVGEVMHDDADGEAEEAVDLTHPLGVALGEVVVDGHDVDAAAGEGVQVGGEGGDEGLAFAGLHLGNLALVEDGAADELDVKVAHADGAAAGLADDGEGFGHEGVEGGLFSGLEGFGVGFGVDAFDGGGYTLAELGGLVAELLVGEGLDGGFERVDLLDDGHETLDGALVGGAEDFGDDGVDHEGMSLRRRGRWNGGAGWSAVGRAGGVRV